MAAEDFFSRWSQRKSQSDQAGAGQPEANPNGGAGVAPDAAPTPEEALPPPTIEDVAKLTPDSDFSRFVKSDVDEAVKRSALKKLFSNPHFNVMDGLDIYIDDYNKFTPMTPALLASLNHAKDLLNPPGLKKTGANSADADTAAVPMEMLSTREDAATDEQQAEQNEAAALDAADASNLSLDAERETKIESEINIEAETSLPLTRDQAAERMPDEQNKARSSPQGDS